ncbi:unnamed protein product [Diabrotica balteata]|uniref:Uncharacterized protein n=1 Tax=Diabrotica balteata TaxID=107213 RepID=A0A9N9T0H4_DIABA|nr:unnamed protein product [Diabrotica balteata]
MKNIGKYPIYLKIRRRYNSQKDPQIRLLHGDWQHCYANNIVARQIVERYFIQCLNPGMDLFLSKFYIGPLFQMQFKQTYIKLYDPF